MSGGWGSLVRVQLTSGVSCSWLACCNLGAWRHTYPMGDQRCAIGDTAHIISPELPALKPLGKCAAIWCLGGPGTAVVSAATSSSSHHLQHSQSSLQVTEDTHLGLPPARVSEGERAASRRSSPLDYAALRKASLLVLDTL